MTHSSTRTSVLSLFLAVAVLALAPTHVPAADNAPTSLMPASGWKVGVHYDALPQAQPMQVAPGQVEVIEFFWLACPHCFAFEPDLQKWQKAKPAYVKFTRVHVVWNPQTAAHARLFYTFRELGRDDLNEAAFKAIHEGGNPLFAPQGPEETLSAHTEFAKAHGLKEEAFQKAYKSSAVDERIKNAAELGRLYRVMGVPTMAVAGKYTADVAKAGGNAQLIELVNDLAAVEKR